MNTRLLYVQEIHIMQADKSGKVADKRQTRVEPEITETELNLPESFVNEKHCLYYCEAP